MQLGQQLFFVSNLLLAFLPGFFERSSLTGLEVVVGSPLFSGSSELGVACYLLLVAELLLERASKVFFVLQADLVFLGFAQGHYALVLVNLLFHPEVSGHVTRFFSSRSF